MKVWIYTLIIFSAISFSIQPEKAIYLQPKKQTYEYADKYTWIVDNLKTTDDSIIKPINRYFQGKTDSCFKVYVSSGLRLNDCKSDHSKGQAIDISMRHVPYDVSNKDVFDYVRYNRNFDQNIIYRDHVHIGYRECENRNEAMRAIKGRWKTYYEFY